MPAKTVKKAKPPAPPKACFRVRNARTDAYVTAVMATTARVKETKALKLTDYVAAIGLCDYLEHVKKQPFVVDDACSE